MPDTKKISVHKVYTKSPKDSSHYTHTNGGHELYMLIQGEVSFSIDGRLYRLEPMDVLIISRSEVHRTIIQSDVPYERIYIYFDPELAAGLDTPGYSLLDIFHSRKPGQGNKISGETAARHGLPELFRLIYEWSQSALPEKNAMMLSVLIQLLVAAGNAYGVPSEDTYKKDDLYNAKIYDIINYIAVNVNKKITLDELEKNFYINKFYLCHLFKKTTGCTVQEYITNKKVSVAKELLARNFSVRDVCNELGFDDYSGFYRAFRKNTGMSPKDYILTNLCDS